MVNQKKISWEEAYRTCLPLIKLNAKKLSLKRRDILSEDDLVNIGLLGLMDAIKKYNPKKNPNFLGYASYRIKGSMIDEMRKLSWIPRSARDRLKFYRGEKEKLQRSGAQPSKKTLSLVTNLNDEQLTEIERVDQIKIISLDKAQKNNFLRPHLPEDRLSSEEVKNELSNAILKLPPKVGTVLRLRILEDLNLSEVAKKLSLSEARISQLHNQGIGLLREILEGQKETLLSA